MSEVYLLTFIHSFIPLACAECHDPLRFSEASSIPLCHILFPSTPFHQLVFHPPSLHLAIYFLVHLSALLFPNSYIILFWEFYFLPFSVHAQTNVIYLTLLSLLSANTPCEIHTISSGKQFRCHSMLITQGLLYLYK